MCGCNCKRQHVEPLNTLSPITNDPFVTATFFGGEKQLYSFVAIFQ